MNWPASRILIIHLVLGATQAVAQNAYITNQGDNTVSVINIATNSVTATIPVGQTPFGVAVTPNGGKVYITNSDGGSVSVIDASSNTVVATIPIGPGPAGVAVAPDGTKVYVANAGEPYSSPGKVSVISTASDTVTATISTGGNFSSFNGLAVTPDGNRIYATEYSAGAVAVIDTASNAITATIPIGRVGSDYTSYGVAITPDGSKVYEADSGGVRVIDAGTNTAGPGIPGAGGTALAVTPDGTRVYTSGGGSISTATDKYLPQSPVAGEILGVSIGVSITPDGTRVYIPSYFPPGSSDSLNVVYVVSTATNALLGTINVGSQPAAFGSFIGRALPPAPTPPEISQITPNTIPVNSSPTTLRILGNGLAGTTFTTCSAPPETVTWNGTTLTISSASATEIDVSVPAILLTTVGNYTVTVSVNQVNGNSCQTLTATGTVQVTSLPGGVLGVSSSSLSLAALSGILPTPQSVQATSTSGTLSYGVSVQYPSAAPANWVALSATAGSTSPGNPGNLMISALSAAASFSSGTYTATVNITAGSQVKTVAVALTITALLNAPSVLVFGAVVGPLAPSTAQDPQTLQVDVAGDPLGFTYTITPAIGQGSVPTCSSLNQATLESSGWLTINGSAVPSGIGTTGQQLLLSVKPVGLGPGTYLDDIVLSAQGSTTTIKVYLVVENLQNVAFNFSYSIGGPAPTQQTAGIFTSGCGVRVANMALGYTSDQSWLTAVLNASGGGFSVNLTATPAGLSAGSYRGVAAVTDGSGDVFLLVCALTVVAPSKTSTATQLSASPNPAIVNQLVTLTATVSPATTGGVVFYDGATSLGSVNLSAGVATMSMAFATVGSHSLTATFSGNATYASSATTPFSLQVNSLPPPPATYITAAPSSQSLGSPVTLTATVCWCVYSGPALPPVPTGTVTFLDGTTQIGSSQLVVGSGSSVATLSISTLAVGTHLLQAAYGGDTSNGPSKSSTVSETITSANTPSILTGGIVNAASFAVANAVGAPVSPGSLVAIFTSALAAQAAIFSTATLPNMLGGASVTFNNIQAPMVQVVPGGAYPFISAQVPFEVLAAGQTSATVPVVITVNNVPSAPVMCQIVASQPGIFTLTANGQGYPVLVNLADYSIAAPVGTASFSHPIPRGQTAFFYVTGLGELTPSVVDGTGTCTASDGLCHATPTPTVSVGGAPATVGFAGQAPGFPGVMQINITIPLTASTGDTVTLTVTSADGTVTSNAATIAVQ